MDRSTLRRGAGAALAAAAALAVAGPAAAAAPKPWVAGLRAEDPVVITGARLGQPPPVWVQRAVGYAVRRGRWVQVPIQVDEKVQLDLARLYAGAFSSGHLTVSAYADPGTLTGADPDRRLDADDELAFMAGDLGGAMPARRRRRPLPASRPPRSVVASSLKRIAVTDPITGRTGYLHLFLARKGSRLVPSAGRRYVDYRFALRSGAGLAAYRRGVGPNPEDTTLATSAYRWHFADRWASDGLAITAGGASGADILDRHKDLFAPGNCGRSEDTFDSGEGAFVTNRAGPVRAIRSYVGANSGPLTQRTHLFYRGRHDVVTDLRVHPIGGILDFLAFSPEASGMTYRSSLQPGGLPIDGRPDPPPPPGLMAWHQATGPQGTVDASYHYDTDIATLAPTGFRQDLASPAGPLDGLSTTQCTGDAQIFGDVGNWIRQPIPNTDPARGPAARFSARITLYLGAPGGTAAGAGLHARQAATPLTAAVG